MNVTDNGIEEILKKYKKVTVLGLSPDATKPSQKVPLYMKTHGHDIVGVYPGEKNIAGFPIYSSLNEVPLEYRKFVDVFRKSDTIPAIVDEIIKLGGTEVLWLQLGITHPEAEKKAETAGIKVVSNRCPHIEYERILNL